MGKSVAEARKYVRVSLGGLRDEAEYADIEKTYIEPCQDIKEH
jgi:ATP-dependent Lon protease